MSSGAIIFKLHFWEHAENMKHLHIQIAIKNERQGNEKACIYRKAVTRGPCVRAGLLWWISELFRNGSVSFARLDWSPLASKAPVITCKLKLEALVWSPSYQTSILPHIKMLSIPQRAHHPSLPSSIRQERKPQWKTFNNNPSIRQETHPFSAQG